MHLRIDESDDWAATGASRSLTLGIPKGSLEEATLALFARVALRFTGAARSLRLSSNDPEIVPVLLRPQEIPVYVKSGRLDAGLSGLDWIVENDVLEDIVLLSDLHYAKQTVQKVRWVLAVPQHSPIETVEDLRAECEWRAENGRPPLRIATELTRVASRWLADNGIDIVPDFSWGATEAKVAADFVDAIIEATETGTSLRENKLREVVAVEPDGELVPTEVFASTTRLFANKYAYRHDSWKRSKLDGIAHLLVSALRAEEMVQLTVIAPANLPLEGILPQDARVMTISAPNSWGSVYAVALVAQARVPSVLPVVIANGALDAWITPLSIFYTADDNDGETRGQMTNGQMPDSERAAANESRISVHRLSEDRPIAEALAEDVRVGFLSSPKQLPPKYFYDVDGSGIFEKITDLPEYYVTRAELDALSRAAEELVSEGQWRCLVELGSGSSRKTRTLLEWMLLRTGSATYSPFDISESALRDAANRLATDYVGLNVDGFVGDFLTADLDAVLQRASSPKLVAFLGSTLGNLTSAERGQLYQRFSRNAASADALLLGVDLVKDASLVELAYNDAAGVTAEFNKNVLRVLRRELGASVDPDDFHHFAPYVATEQRIEMRLYAERDVAVTFTSTRNLQSFTLRKGEYILTELSQKFTREGLEGELSDAGLRVDSWHTDANGWVALALVKADLAI